jgi:hypothetical protein
MSELKNKDPEDFYDDRTWWQGLEEDVYHRALTPYELKGEFERICKKEFDEEVTSEQWDMVIEQIRDWYSGEQYEPTPEEVIADAEYQKKTYLYWDAMDSLLASLERPLTLDDSKHQRGIALDRQLTKKESQKEEYLFEEWAGYRVRVESSVAEATAAHELGMKVLCVALLYGGKEDGSLYSEDELDALIKQHMTYAIWADITGSITDLEGDAASDRTIKGHAKRYPAIDFVKAEWAKYRLAYQGNKSEFARIYSRRVLNEHGVKVTDKQIREVWLKNTPVACNPDGMQATG